MRRAVPAVAALVLFLVALEVLRRELHAVTWQALSIGVLGIPRWLLASAVLLTALNYAVLTGYDFIALASIRGRQPQLPRLPRLRVAVTSFLAYAIANSVGFAMLSGASIRYRVYSRWGISGEQFSQVVISYSGRTYADGKKIGRRDAVRAVYCIGRYSKVGDRFRRRN